ncbi:MAG: hypothetical protein CME33_20760 [Gimesia sp.]|uniref:hypothetical protein n=1 Tax=Gimesia sp. TaxID=2024833 RepID=UPI000C5B3788|nr:hypothetical protein [Gimesia sp.]MAX38986.1 hypothetical protein [Gimesia sp.]
MTFSHALTWCALMLVLLAASAIESSEQKENAQLDKPFRNPEKIKKKQVGKWEASKARLLRSGKQPAVVINAKSTKYELIDDSKHFTALMVTAFSDSESGSIWGGPEQDGYLEIENNILGFRLIEFHIYWSESSLNHDPKSTSPDFTNRFEKEVTGGSLYVACKGRTNLEGVIKDSRVFRDGWNGSGPPRPIVTEFQWDKNLLKLSILAESEEHEATVWIDVKSKEVKKAEEKRSKLGEKIFQEQVEAARVRADKMAKEKNNQ